MHIQQACQILGIHINDPDLAGSAKRSFRQLSKEYHPDKRDDNDDTKFKEINNAYAIVTEFIKNPYGGQPQQFDPWPAGFGVNIGGMHINVQAGQTIRQTIDEHGNVTIEIEM